MRLVGVWGMTIGPGSTIRAWRMVGSTVGIAVFGGIISARLAIHRSLTPDALAHLPGAVRELLANAYAHALSGVFLAAPAATIVGLALAMLLPDVRLAGDAGQARSAGRRSSRPGSLRGFALHPLAPAAELDRRGDLRRPQQQGGDHERGLQ